MPARTFCLIAILLLGCPATVLAAEPSGETQAQAGDDKDTPPEVSKAATPPQGKSPDTFRPSEEISEDLSVSFPADI